MAEQSEYQRGVEEGVNRALLMLETVSAMDPSLVPAEALARVLEVYDQVDWATFKPPEPAAPDNSTPTATAAEWIHRATAASHVRAELAADRKINAIKEMRAATAMGLKEAKDAVEEYQRRYMPTRL